MIFKWNIRKWKIGIGIHREGEKEIFGYTNRCDDGKFIVFLDYDDLPLEWVVNELRYLQKDFNLGSIYVFESSKNSYHALCFSKVCLKTLMRILYNSSVDENYYRIPYTIGKRLLTLRLSKKGDKQIKFVTVLNGFCERLESKEHKFFFNKLFKGVISKFDLHNNNDLEHPTKIICSHYKVK